MTGVQTCALPILDIVYSSAETAVAATPVIAVKVATDTTVFFIK